MAAAEICARLDRSVFDPMVLFMYDAKDGLMPQVLKERNVPFHNFKYSRTRRFLGPVFPAIALRRLKPDLLHVHHIPLLTKILPASRLAGVKRIVFTEHAKYSISRSPSLQEACRKAAREVDFFTVVSRDLRDYFSGEVGIPPEAMVVVHNGVDINRFSPGPRTQYLRGLVPANFKRPLMITVGRLTDAKDHSGLLAAMELLKKNGEAGPCLVLVGDGELRPAIEREIESRGIGDCVHMAGKRTDISALLAGADIFVLPSKREGFPVSVLEAMASGLPVIATKVGGIPEVIKDGENGLLVPPGDPVGLSKAIARLVSNPAFGAELGARARKTVEEEFSLDFVAGAYSDLYLKLYEKDGK